MDRHTALEIRRRFLLANCAQDYRPPLWLRNPHLQTLWIPIRRLFRKAEPVPLRRELFRLGDGDSITLHHHDAGSGAPRVLILHGLEGSVRSATLQILAGEMIAAGWSVTVMEFRGCGGPLNLAPRLYHSGETGDLGEVVEALLTREPGAPLYAVGFSMGGNVLGKYLGEQGEAARLAGAILLSSPTDLTACGPRVDEVLFGFYRRVFLGTLLPKALAKERQYPLCIDAKAAAKCRTIVDYDHIVTAPLHGYADAWDYYRRCSASPLLPLIRVPTLVLCAMDDPLIPRHTIPCGVAEESPWLVPFFPENGGHIGFLDSGGHPRYPNWCRSYLEQCEAVRRG